jgi:hypothetical protein
MGRFWGKLQGKTIKIGVAAQNPGGWKSVAGGKAPSLKAFLPIYLPKQKDGFVNQRDF